MTKNFDDDDLKRIFIWCAAGLFTTLAGGNMYFVSRLVDKMDSTANEVWSLRQQVTILAYRVEEQAKEHPK